LSLREPRPTLAAPSWWLGSALVLAIILVYANSLAGPFVLDDEATIVRNVSIRDLGRPAAVFTPDAASAVAGRPLANLSFALNYAWGGLDVTGFHVVNIALHAACALLLMAICRRTLTAGLDGGPGSAELRPGESHLTQTLRRHAVMISFGVAMLWAVHPLNSEVVDYLSQRTESLMAVCFLLTIYAAIRAGETGAGHWDAVAIIACTLGMMGKESMAPAPVIVALYDRLILFGSWRRALAVRRRLYAGLAGTWVILAALVAGAPRSDVAGFSAGVPVWTNLLNQAVMIVRYIRLTFWPSDLVAFYGWHHPFMLGDVLPHVLLIAVLLLAAFIAMRRAPLLGFAGACFFLTLAPSSSIVPIATEVGAERRMYLPSAALAALVAGMLLLVLARFCRGRPAKPFAAVVMLAAAVLGVRTYARNREYASGLTLAQTIVDRRPTAVAFHILGEQLQAAGRDDEAAVALREAVRRGNSRANYPLGVALINRRDYVGAIDRLDAFVQTSGQRMAVRWLEPAPGEIVTAQLLMGRAYLTQGDGDRAAAQADAVLRVYPRHVEAHALLGAARFRQQRWPEVIAAYGPYLAARPRDVDALINIGVASVATGAIDDAVGAFERAAAVEPQNERARRLLEMAQRDRVEIAQRDLAGTAPDMGGPIEPPRNSASPAKR
jgi:tetratricopeptide (TPR) repeat protein